MTAFLLVLWLVWADGGSVRTVAGPFPDEAACLVVVARGQAVLQEPETAKGLTAIDVHCEPEART